MNYTKGIVGFSVAVFISGGPLFVVVADAADAPVYKPPTRGAPGGALEAVHAEPNVMFLFSRCWRRITVVSLRVNSLLFTGTFPRRLRFRWSLP